MWVLMIVARGCRVGSQPSVCDIGVDAWYVSGNTMERDTTKAWTLILPALPPQPYTDLAPVNAILHTLMPLLSSMGGSTVLERVVCTGNLARGVTCVGVARL